MNEVEREFESVKADIAAFKAVVKSEGERYEPALRELGEVFACSSEAIDETCGGADLLDCICKDEDVHPQAICPQHGEVFD